MFPIFHRTISTPIPGPPPTCLELSGVFKSYECPYLAAYGINLHFRTLATCKNKFYGAAARFPCQEPEINPHDNDELSLPPYDVSELTTHYLIAKEQTQSRSMKELKNRIISRCLWELKFERAEQLLL